MNLQLFDHKWYVVYTMPRWERQVACSISQHGVDVFLPVHKVVKQWSDRRKQLEVPLFPNYVFVKVAEASRKYLRPIKGLVRFVSIENKPVVIREQEIIAIKKILNEKLEVSSADYFEEGMKVKISKGPFVGLEGIIVQKNSGARLIIKVEGIMKAFAVNLSAHLAEAI